MAEGTSAPEAPTSASPGSPLHQPLLHESGLKHVTGEAKYVDDLAFAGLLVGQPVPSAHAHARIRGIDVSKAKAVPGVVGTLMTNMAVEVALKRLNIPLVRAKVGDRYVLEELSSRGWQLGGESSGHLLALDRHTTGDGIVSSLQIMQAIRRSGKTLAALLEGVKEGNFSVEQTEAYGEIQVQSHLKDD